MAIVRKFDLASFVAVLAVSVILVGFLTHSTHSCNEQVCRSIVSKCMLTQSCNCDMKNCTCCKECFSCLNYLYGECCSCVDMCPKPNETQQARQLTSLPDKLVKLIKYLIYFIKNKISTHPLFCGYNLSGGISRSL